ncbi:MAG: hypothetical protein G3M78_06305 [Candidatus Nitrohelix vancouverensis]|uniref:Uncharacterized protein n=1 Tax=Candidatus Nitrohelix vancouverensis TaxID=2705534 RepID=A0A7T0C1Z1_9BACT|nr:MAG: hypothetical protein G3M78_06305 [Candidatus Nitrohelix vancouverensis]
MNQAFEISNRLEAIGVHSPVSTTYADVDSRLPSTETLERVQVSRHRILLPLMRYSFAPGVIRDMKDFDILHAHNYRNFLTDAGFFLPANISAPSSSARMAPCSATRNT